MPIKILSEEVAAKISAGEVVERPSSVVKELIENSIDAGAGEIIVHIEQAGKRLIEVSDDGVGIHEEDLPLTIERHATSKIETAEDLTNLHTLGFRGEALASIAAVSEFTLLSHPNQCTQGRLVHCVGGGKKSIEPVGAPFGTSVKVENLFFNTPARLKFLKQEITERRQIVGLVSRYAMAYAHIRFQLTLDGRLMLQTTGDGDRRATLAQLYTIEEAKKMLDVEHQEGGIQVQGFISPVGLTRSTRKDITFFLNGHWVQDSSLSAALLQSYSTFLMVGRYPIAFLMVNMPPEDVDVNVHPAKTEIRLKNPAWIFSNIQRAVRRTLLANQSTPELLPTFWKMPLDGQSGVQTTWSSNHETGADQQEKENSIDKQHFSPDSSILQPLTSQIPLLRLVGQIGAAYLVAEGPDGLYLIDQHAAHERILFEEFMKNADPSKQSQLLIEPLTIQLPGPMAQLLNENLPLLDTLGFGIEEFGKDTFRIRSIPAIFSMNDPILLINSVIEDFEEDETPFKDENRNRIIARICKRSAIKSGKFLSHEEQLKLLSDLEKCESPRTCPHGRPTMIHLSVDLLERQFGRRGSR